MKWQHLKLHFTLNNVRSRWKHLLHILCTASILQCCCVISWFFLERPLLVTALLLAIVSMQQIASVYVSLFILLFFPSLSHRIYDSERKCDEKFLCSLCMLLLLLLLWNESNLPKDKYKQISWRARMGKKSSKKRILFT